MLVAVFALGVASSAVAEDNADANKLFVETMQLLKQAKSASRADAVDLYERALKNLDEIVSDYPSSSLAVQIVSGQPIGNVKRDDIVEGLQKARYAVCAEQATATCLFQQAADIALAIDNAGTKDWSLGNLALNQADAGRYGEAVDTVSGIQSRRSYFLAQIGWYQARAGKADGARMILAKAAAMVGDPSDRSAEASRLAALSAGYAQAGDTEQATKLLSEAEASFNALDADGRDAASFDVVQAQAVMHQMPRALKTAMAASNTFYRSWAFFSIAWLQADSGAFDDAYQTADNSIGDSGVQASALGAIATRQALAGDLQGAKAGLDKALGIARGIFSENEYARDLAWSNIVAAQAATGDINGAAESAIGIKDVSLRIWAISSVAVVLAKTGKP